MMRHAPIIVLVILALGLAAVTLYRPHDAVRANAIGGVVVKDAPK
jgi:hypothetical protein